MEEAGHQSWFCTGSFWHKVGVQPGSLVTSFQSAPLPRGGYLPRPRFLEPSWEEAHLPTLSPGLVCFLCISVISRKQKTCGLFFVSPADSAAHVLCLLGFHLLLWMGLPCDPFQQLQTARRCYTGLSSSPRALATASPVSLTWLAFAGSSLRAQGLPHLPQRSSTAGKSLIFVFTHVKPMCMD